MVAAALPVVELRNVDIASLLGARIVMLVALLRADTRDGFVPRRPADVSWDWEERSRRRTGQGAEG